MGQWRLALGEDAGTREQADAYANASELGGHEGDPLPPLYRMACRRSTAPRWYRIHFATVRAEHIGNLAMSPFMKTPGSEQAVWLNAATAMLVAVSHELPPPRVERSGYVCLRTWSGSGRSAVWGYGPASYREDATHSMWVARGHWMSWLAHPCFP